MLTDLQDILTSFAALLCGFAVGGAWIAIVVVPNASFDQLDHSRADRHVREVVRTGSTPVAIALLVAAACALLGAAYAASAVAALSAFGFFTNRWTLAINSKKASGSGDSKNYKSQRAVAVGLSLAFSLVAITAGIMAAIGF